MEMMAVVSSNIRAIGYDDKGQEMFIDFNNGRRFKYLGVTKKHFDEFKRSKSKGTHFHSQIKPYFKALRVE